MRNKTAILVHGYSLMARKTSKSEEDIERREWDHVVWGDIENQLLGRIPKGILLALIHDAKMIIFGSGASCQIEEEAVSYKTWGELGKPLNIVWEADFTYKDMLQRFNDLNRFREVKKAISSIGGMEKIYIYIESIAIRDNKSRNTKEELCNALRECNKEGIEVLLSVSNLSHAPRCTALALNEIIKMKYSTYFVPSPSDTDFSKEDETLIFEPQSGPGPTQEIQLCTVLKECLCLSEKMRYKFLNQCKDFFSANRNDTDL